MISATADSAPREHFGPYTLIRKIGQGGMAEVFLADPDGARPGEQQVVIKRLHQELENNRDAVDLFLTEADVTLLLTHPNVIRVHDSGEAGGRYYIAMEYVHGKDLAQICDRLLSLGRTMDTDVAVHIMIEVLKGLAYVHHAKTVSGRPLGIVHRDVTPSNIYVSTTGQVKLGDFGVAKLVGVEGWTMAGSLKGKLGYLSPEQIAGEPPDQSIDLWSAAVVLFELLAGHRAFAGDNELDVMLRIKDAKLPAIKKMNPDVPKPLIAIVEKALHRKAKKRYQSAQELHDELVVYRATYGQTFSEQQLVAVLTQRLA